MDRRSRVKARGRRRRRRVAEHARALRAELSYMPLTVFVSLCAATLGLYPYLWLASRAWSFAALDPVAFDARAALRYCAVAAAAHCLLVLSAVPGLVWLIGGYELAAVVTRAMLSLYAALALLVVLPLRWACLTAMRWAMRSAAAAWAADLVIIPRTMRSLLATHLLGTVYAQAHINRLVGLGMPGLAGYDDMWNDVSAADVVRDFLRGSG